MRDLHPSLGMFGSGLGQVWSYSGPPAGGWGAVTPAVEVSVGMISAGSWAGWVSLTGCPASRSTSRVWRFVGFPSLRSGCRRRFSGLPPLRSGCGRPLGG
jgi:hypothetical protein